MSIDTAAPVGGEEVRTRVLIVTADPIGERMAGPAIRVWHIAEELSSRCDVRVVSWREVERTHSAFELHHVGESDDRTMQIHEAWADVIIVQGFSMRNYPSIASTQKILVADLYDPFQFEQLEQNKDEVPAKWNEEVQKAISLLSEQLRRADCFLCASERQRDMWLGALSLTGRLNPLTYHEDSAFESLLRVVPFGLPSNRPVQSRSAIKGVVNGIASTDRVLLWGGGIYNWFDPITLVRAMGLLRETAPEVKLFFLSSAHFDSEVPTMRVLAETVQEATALGLVGHNVFFNEEWVDYDDRVNFLLDADLGVSTHTIHAETRFSFRTRILDYLWADLPIVATDGDSFAELISEHQIGIAVPAEDPAALANAIRSMLFDVERRTRALESLPAVRTAFEWQAAVAPLLDFCVRPVRAGDRVPGAKDKDAARFDRILLMRRGIRRDLLLLWHYAATGGWERVREKIRRRQKRLAR